MRKLILLAFIATQTCAFAQLKFPLGNAILTTDLQGNGKNIINLGTVTLGSGAQGTKRLHLVPNGNPTTAADGIGFGSDLALYRSASGMLTLSGSLTVTGSINGTSLTTVPWNMVTSKPTTVAGYAISDALTTAAAALAYQPLSANLTSWSAVTPSNYLTTSGVTTTGQNFLTLTNPSAVTWARINADNTITTRTAEQTRADLKLGVVVVNENDAWTTMAGKECFYVGPVNSVIVSTVTPWTRVTNIGTDTITFQSTAGPEEVAVRVGESVAFSGNDAGGGEVTVAEVSRVSLSINQLTGSTTVGKNLVKLSNPGAVRFLRVNADNTISALSDADTRTALGLGTAATTASTDYATAAQGTKADAAIPTPTSPVADNVLQYKSGSWAQRTMAQLFADLMSLMDARYTRFSSPLGIVKFSDSHLTNLLPNRIQIKHSGATSTRIFIYSQNNLNLATNDIISLDSIGIVPDPSAGYGGYYVVSAGSFTAPNDTSQQPTSPAGPTNGVINWQTAYGTGITVYWAELAAINTTFTPVTLAADAGYFAEGVFLGGVTLANGLNTSWGTIWAEACWRTGGTAGNYGAIDATYFKMGNSGTSFAITRGGGGGGGMPTFQAMYGSPTNGGGRTWGMFAHKNLTSDAGSGVYLIEGSVEFRFTPTGSATGSFTSTWTNP